MTQKMPFIHPGEMLKTELVDEAGLNITEIARLLQVSRQAVSGIMNQRTDISPEMAVRIAVVFGGTPDIWMRLQVQYDLSKAAQKIKTLKLIPYKPRRIA